MPDTLLSVQAGAVHPHFSVPSLLPAVGAEAGPDQASLAASEQPGLFFFFFFFLGQSGGGCV